MSQAKVQEGRDAWLAGFSSDENPHIRGWDSFWWATGWNYAQAEYERRKLQMSPGALWKKVGR